MRLMCQTARNVLSAATMGGLLASCGSDNGAKVTGRQERPIEVALAEPNARQLPSPIRTDEQVDQLVEAANKRGEPLLAEDVARLTDAARRGVAAAAFALYWHHSTDGDAAQSEPWFSEALSTGLPNAAVIQAQRDIAEAREATPTERAQLLASAKSHLRAALIKSGKLTVDSAQSLRAELREIELIQKKQRVIDRKSGTA